MKRRILVMQEFPRDSPRLSGINNLLFMLLPLKGAGQEEDHQDLAVIGEITKIVTCPEKLVRQIFLKIVDSA